jgi:hypothetical protein
MRGSSFFVRAAGMGCEDAGIVWGKREEEGLFKNVIAG